MVVNVIVVVIVVVIAVNIVVNGNVSYDDPHHHQVLGGWRLGSDGSSRKSDAYFCGGGNTTTVPDIYGEMKNENTNGKHSVEI